MLRNAVIVFATFKPIGEENRTFQSIYQAKRQNFSTDGVKTETFQPLEWPQKMLQRGPLKDERPSVVA
jgi:hypothetical protein